VTNVPREDGPVKPPEVIEITGLLAEVIRTGQVARAGAPSTADAGRRGASPGAPPAAGPAGSGDGAASGDGAVSLPSPHVIRAAIFVHENGPQTIGQLARGLGASQGWTSRIVDELERAGYVEKRRDPDDRRVVRVGLTPMAGERVERAVRWRGDSVEAALAGMGPEERAAVVTFLRRFLERSQSVR
jgi:DNA-binding MarR family transcriptional regulator